MEALNNSKTSVAPWFLLVGMCMLLAGMVFGILGGLQYVIPGFMKAFLSFEKIRPLHVSSVVFWILLAASGSVLLYIQEYSGKKLYSETLARIQLLSFTTAIIAILISYMAGIFGGREYWEFPPPIAALIVLGWIAFVINFIKTSPSFRNQPVYHWMWLTGSLGFLFIFLESYLWLIPYFQKDIVRDMTVQWKSYGSLVGCWNMLIYGAGLYLMEKISGNKKYAHSRMAFALFFLGFFNLCFNWSHHIYTLPIPRHIKHVGYLVSMTELFILGKIIFSWNRSLTDAQKYKHIISYRFLMAADFWVFINLILAILMSVPAINRFTHGTHITVAHVMGTTIGINTMLLVAVCFDVIQTNCKTQLNFTPKIVIGYWLANASLVVFMIALVTAGIQRSQWQLQSNPVPFQQMMKNLVPHFIVFTIAGGLLCTGFFIALLPLLRNAIHCQIFKRKSGFFNSKPKTITN